MINADEWMYFILSRAGKVSDDEMEEAFDEWQAER